MTIPPSLLQTIRRQFCNTNEAPHSAGIAIGVELGKCSDETAILELLLSADVQPIVIHSTLHQLSDAVFLEDWLVQFDQHQESSSSVCRTACIAALSKSTRPRQRLDRFWQQLSASTQEELAHAMIQQRSSSQPLTNLFHCLVLQSSGTVFERSLRTLQRCIWNHNHPDYDAKWLESILILYRSLPYCQRCIAHDLLEFLQDLHTDDIEFDQRHVLWQTPTTMSQIHDDLAFLRVLAYGLADPTLRVSPQSNLTQLEPLNQTQRTLLRTYRIITGGPHHHPYDHAVQDKQCNSVFHTNPLWKFLRTCTTTIRSNLSAPLQFMGLLLGVLYLEDDNDTLLLTVLLRQYPSLGVSLIPILLQRIESSSEHILPLLELCIQACVHPVAAQTMWNVAFRHWLSPYAPEPLLHTIVRRLPNLVAVHPRLRNRVIAALLKQHRSVVVAATLAELAERDLIRDVAEIIGTVQAYLTQAKDDPYCVYYGLQCLFHLVRSDELDFDVVVKVLQKKLCALSEHSILQQPAIVQEGIALFLGSGGGNDYEDSTQTRLAVECLLSMGKARTNPPRLQSLIFSSLSMYSLSGIGVNEEDVQKIVSDAREGRQTSCVAAQLRDLVFSGLSGLSPESEDLSLIALATKLMEYEEEALGPSLWHGSKVAVKSSRESLASRITQLRSVPDNDLLSRLLLEASPKLESVGDMMDELLDAMSSPLDTILIIQGILVAMHKIRIAERDVDHSEAIQNWGKMHVSSDAITMALACYACVEPSASPGRNAIARKAIDDFNSMAFENTDLMKIALGLLGAALLGSGELSLVNEINGLLKHSISGYGGYRSFAGFYGLGLIAQSSAQMMDASKPSPYDTIGLDGCRTILNEMVHSFGVEEHIQTILFNAFDEEMIADDVWRYIDSLSSVVGPKTNEGTVLSILYCVALIQAPLSIKRPDIARVLHRLLPKLDAGIDLGVAVCASTKACHLNGTISAKALCESITEIAATIEDGICWNPIAMACAVEGSRWVAAMFSMRLPTDASLHGNEKNPESLILGQLMSLIDLPLFGVLSKGCVPALSHSYDNDLIDATIESLMSRIAKDDTEDEGWLLMNTLGFVSSACQASVEDETSVALQNDDNSSAAIDFGKLPTPQGGTLVARVMENVRQALSLPPSVETACFMRRAFASLEKLSIPEKYCRGLLKPLIDGVEYRSITAKLLVNQVSIRRRAYSSGTAFVDQAVVLCKQSADVWRTFSVASIVEVLIQFGDFGHRIPSQQFESVLADLWNLSVRLERGSAPALRVLFLQSLTNISKNARSQPYVATTRKFAMQNIFGAFSHDEMAWTISPRSDSVSILQAASLFLNEIPSKEILDDPDFVVEARHLSSENIVSYGFKLMVMLRWGSLEPQLHLQRSAQVQRYVEAFLSKAISVPDCPCGLVRRVLLLQAASIATALVEIDPIIDLLLVVSTKQRWMVLEWLALTCHVLGDPDVVETVSPSTFFGHDVGAVEQLLCLPNDELAEHFQSLLSALPEMIATLALRDKTAKKVSNDLARVLDLCNEEDSDVVSILTKMLVRCHSAGSVHASTIMEHWTKTNGF